MRPAAGGLSAASVSSVVILVVCPCRCSRCRSILVDYFLDVALLMYF